jgi:dihydroorotate dehydrogenase
MLLPYSLIRPLFFSFDAETIHDLTLKALHLTQNTWVSKLFLEQNLVSDPLKLMGLEFPNRVGLAAGLDKNASVIDAFAAFGMGHIEVGTVTPLAQSGNPKPRIFRLEKAQALINRLGFNNQGVEVFLDNVQKAHIRNPNGKKPSPVVLGLNIGKNAQTPIERATEDYLKAFEAVYPHADYVTVNISSPNTKNLRTLQADDALDALMGALAERRELLQRQTQKRVPLLIKIAPDLDESQITLLASTFKKHAPIDSSARQGDWGIICSNTTLSRQGVQDMALSGQAGGLSGAPLLHPSNAVLSTLRQAMGEHFPIVGVGGIMGAQDAREKLKAGADLVQIYSGLIYKGPRLIEDIALALQSDRREKT